MPKTAIIYIIFFLGSLISSIIIDPCWGIYLYEVHYFFNPQNRWWYTNIPGFFNSFLISLVIIGAFLVRWKKYNKTQIFSAPQAKWILWFFILMCITSLYAVWPERHYEYLFYQFKLFVIIALAYKIIDTPDKFDKMMVFYLLGIFYLGWVAYSLGRIGSGRIEGIGTVDGLGANDTAAVMVTAIPFLIVYLMRGKKWQQFIAAFAFAFIINGIILINSRGAFLAVIVGCSYMFFLLLTNKILGIREKRKVLIGMIISIALFIYLADATFWLRVNTLGNLGEELAEGKAVGRTYFWLKTFELVKQYPLGTGVSGYTFLSPQFLPADMLTQGHRAVHSTYFQVLAEYGYLGFALFSGLVLSNFKTMKKIKASLIENNEDLLYCKAVAIESSFLSYLVAAAFLDRLYAVVPYWLMLFIGCFYNINLIKVREKTRGV